MESAEDMFRQDGDFLEYLMSLPQPLERPAAAADNQTTASAASTSDAPSKVRQIAKNRLRAVDTL
jgi:hypothetical protein